MAGVSANYGLATGVLADDLIEPQHHNRVADTVDRVLGWFLKRMMAAGVYEGWSLALDGTVTAGEGLVGACWCATTGAQSVADLTPGAVNYVFAGTDSDSAPKGTVRFFAALSPTRPAGSLLLGTMTLDGSGAVTAVDDWAGGVDRDCRRLHIGRASGSGLSEAVPPGGSVTVPISHDTVFVVPGAIEVEVAAPDFVVEVWETYRADGFVVVATNQAQTAQDFEYSWTRSGFVA